MTEVVPAAPAVSAVARQWATRAAFFLAGLSMSSWAPLVPFVKHRMALDDGRLGLLLLCLGLGSVIGMPLAGALAGRYGCRWMIGLSAAVACLALPLLAVAGQVGLIAATLLVFGAGVGTLDVTMNIHAVLVEREAGRPMMSGFHGLYSVGGIVGAGGVSLLFSAGVAPVWAMLAVTVLGLMLLAASVPSLLPFGGDPDAPAFAVPHGRVLLFGCFCFVLFLAEGSVLDWSAVFLTTLRQTARAHAGFGYVAFAIAMTTCRLSGDLIVHRLGPAKVVLFGSLCAAAGFGLAAIVPNAVAAVVGFGLVGMGASNVVPVMFSAAGRQTAMPTNLALAAMTTLGYAGILLGPAAIGGMASAFGLPGGLAMVAAALVGVALVSTRVRL